MFDSHILVHTTQRLHRNIDVQKVFFAIVNWPNLELYGASVCIMYFLDQSATKPAGQFFPDCGVWVWVSVDFDSKDKILRGETRAHGVPIHRAGHIAL